MEMPRWMLSLRMIAVLVLPVVFLSLFAIYARERRPALYGLAKPLPVLWILLWSALVLFVFAKSEASRPIPVYLIFAGLGLGLAGDIFLLKKSYFLPGYLAFAAGHLAYIVGFVGLHPLVLFWPYLLLLCLPGVVYAVYLSRVTKQKAKIPLILAYAAIITGMLVSASNLYLGAQKGQWIFYGAVLFCVSDGLWSFHNFARPLKRPGVWILSTYYAGQALIAAGSFLEIWNGSA